jgi:acetolactate synthase-1/2/3 large subunit
MDIFSRPVPADLAAGYPLPADAGRPALPAGVADRIAGLLTQAERPLIYIGGGLREPAARRSLLDLAEHLDIPIAHSLMAKGAIPDGHPLLLGMTGFWGLEFANAYARGADVVLALGTRFAETDASSWHPDHTWRFPPSRLIQIDIDPAEIGRNFPAEIGAVADLKQALSALNRAARKLLPEGIQRPERRGEIAAARALFLAGNRAHTQSNDYPMRPERILADVREALPRNAFITTDVGWNKNGVGQQFPIYEPGSILTPGGYATMGFGAPAAMGAKLARPDRVVVALVGDGGFGQNPALLATAFEQDIAVVWVIMNNYAYGTIAGLEKAHFGSTYGTVFEKHGKPYSPDYAAIAKAYGIDGVKIESAAQFRPALERAINSNRPCAIDVVMQNEPVPTAGHWNIMDIYSPGKKVHHTSTTAAPVK